MNWFKRKKREDGFRITGYPDNRITGTGQKPCVPDPRIPGTVRSRRLTSYLLPLASALFTGFLMIHTAAVLSSPQDFITGGGGQTDWTTASSGATATVPAVANYATYDSKDPTIVAAGNIQLKSTGYTVTDDGTVSCTTDGGTATGGGFAAGLTQPGTTSTAVSGSVASVWLEIFLTKTLDKRDNFIHKAWYS